MMKRLDSHEALGCEWPIKQLACTAHPCCTSLHAPNTPTQTHRATCLCVCVCVLKKHFIHLKYLILGHQHFVRPVGYFIYIPGGVSETSVPKGLTRPV